MECGVYGLSGFTLGSGTITSTTTPSYSMSGLTDNTSYDVHVQADCGSGNVSQWVGPLTITTAVAPVVVVFSLWSYMIVMEMDGNGGIMTL